MVTSQSRTQLWSAKKLSKGIVYDNSNLQKYCKGVTTPLTYSFTKRVYAVVFKQTLKVLPLSDKGILRNESVCQDLIALIKGRIYYNISSWYYGFRILHPFHQSKTILAQILGLSEPLNFEDEENVKGLWEKCSLLWERCVHLPRFIIVFKSLNSKIPKFIAKMEEYYSEFYDQDFENKTIAQLKDAKKQIDKDILNFWTTPVINDLYILTSSGIISERLSKAGLENSAEIITGLLTDNAFASLEPARHLHRLALEVSHQPDLTTLVNQLPNDIHKQVKTNFKKFYKAVIDFIDCFGDRNPGELKLETETIRSNPIIFYRYLRDCLNAQIANIRTNKQTQQIGIKELEHQLSHLSLLHKKHIFSKLARFQKAIAHRERFRLERSRVFGMYRTIYNAVGVLFERNNWIESAEDIFYLTETEIFSGDNASGFLFRAIIEKRKAEFQCYKTVDSPARIIVSDDFNEEEIACAPPKIVDLDSKEDTFEVA